VAEITNIFGDVPPELDVTGFRTGMWSHGVALTPAELRPMVPTLLHALAHAAKASDRTGIFLEGDQVGDRVHHRPYRAIYHDARRLAGQLLERGLAPGDTVLLVAPTSFEFVVGFFAVQMAGAIPVPAYPPAVLERAEQALARLELIARVSGARLCLTTAAVRPILGGLALAARGGRGVRAIEAIDALATAPAARVRAEPRPAPTDPAFIQFTSGSTGDPKGVVIEHRHALANIHAVGQALKVNRRDVTVGWLPLYHDMGLVGTLLWPIYWRLPAVLMSPVTFLQNPRRWLEAITRHRGTLSAAPNFAYALCTARIPPAERAGLDLSSWRVTLNGAEAVSARTVAEFTAAFAPVGFRAETMRPVYGLAESTVAVAFSPVATPPRVVRVDRAALAAGSARPAAPGAAGADAIELVSVGRPVPGHELEIVDDHGTPLPERTVGHIVVTGPSLMAGYHRAPEATARALRGGVLWTGDLGFVDGGELYITGRAKDLIIVRGRNHAPEDLERAAGSVTGVRAGNVVAFAAPGGAEGTERVVLVCETRLAAPAERAALARAVADEVQASCGVGVDEVVLAAPGTLPKTSSGKLQRGRTREHFLAGTLGEQKTGKLELALIMARSGAGLAKTRLLGLLRGRSGRKA
jgi:acyl-CoA synthetase (AMP-forming)/AMP-acid ligase II